MSYTVIDFGTMIKDSYRMDAYTEALRKSINNKSVVLDLGTGTGIFALLACQFGAKRVYAIDINPAIHVAKKIASENGFSDKIIFFNEISTNVKLPEKVDIIVSDLRGKLPLLGNNIKTLTDARKRFLKKNGKLIPERDKIWAALVESPSNYRKIVSIWESKKYKITQTTAKKICLNNIYHYRVGIDHLISNSSLWQNIDFKTVNKNNFKKKLIFKTKRKGIVHGIFIWFDSNLINDVKLINSPMVRGSNVYGRAFFPLLKPAEITKGDLFIVDLSANLVSGEYIWSWKTEIYTKSKKTLKAKFNQSTFFGSPISPTNLVKRAHYFKPVINENGKLDLMILKMILKRNKLLDIAKKINTNFPEKFKNINQSLSYVGNLSEKYSE